MRYLKRSEVYIPLSFLLISSLWVIFSDKWFLTVEKNVTVFEITEIQTIKGCLFVVAVTFLIHFMIKSSNKRLRQSQEEYKDLFYNTPNPMLILDLKTNKFLNVNKAALETYGYTAEEFADISPTDLRLNPVSAQWTFKGDLCNTYEHKKKDHETVICLELTKKISFKNSPATLLCINDVTALEEAKSELLHRETLLNQVLNSITDGFLLLTPDLAVKNANKLFEEIAGLSSKDMEGQKLLDLFPGIEEGISYKNYIHAITTHNPVHFETYGKKLNKWFDVSAYPFEGGLSVFFRDITKEKEDQLQRQQNEQNLLALINNTEDLMWSVDCDFNYFIFNEPYKQNYRRAFDEEVYVGKSALNDRQGIGHVQKWKALYERALKGEKFTVDMDFALEEDSYFTTIRLNPIYDENNQIIGAGCFMQDITERKLQLKKIEQQNEQLKQIAFITSHKVRVPLANILGLTEILDNEDPLSATNCKIIEHIKTSAKDLDKSIIHMVQQTVYAND